MTRLRRKLLAWYARAARPLPWRQTRDPYRIWVSEVMLQQTRVAAVLPYYERFLERFPTVEALAAAPETDVLAAWAGLGYYSRARNVQKAARQILAAGGFPSDYESIRSLAGVGDYTAAAIASIAFDLPFAVLDGNVMRVIARLTGEDGDLRSSATLRRLRDIADTMLDRRNPGRFNQALMELGATVCLPRQPQCLLCPITAECVAFRAGSQEKLPVKSSGAGPIQVSKTLLIIQQDGRILLWQRPADSQRMARFWEVPEADQLPQACPGEEIGRFRHTITRHNYTFTVRRASLRSAPRGFRWTKLARLDEVLLSTVARKALAALTATRRSLWG